MASLIAQYAVNVPFGDDWVLAQLFQKADSGTLGLSDFWALHNEHRVFFPKLFMFMVANLTDWNIRVQIWLNFVLMFSTALVIANLVYKGIRKVWVSLSIIVVMSFWFFSPVQSENWIWAWQFSWYLTILTVLVTFVLINKVKNLQSSAVLFIICAALSVIASFSLGGGSAVWLIGLIILYFNSTGKQSYITWSFMGLITNLIYYVGYSKPSTSPSILYFLEHKQDTLVYFVTLIGRPISDNQQTSILIGLLILGSLLPLSIAIWYKRKDIRKFVPIMAMSAYCMVTLGLTTISRVGFGVEQATASRYTTLTIIFIVSILIMIGFVLDTTRDSKSSMHKIQIGLAAIIVINAPLIVFSYHTGIDSLKQRAWHMELAYQCTHQEVVTDECANVTFPGFGGVVKDNSIFIKDKSWGGY
jgi:hypothetical protein